MASSMPVSLEDEDKHVEKIPMTEDTFDSGTSPSNGGDLMPHKFAPNMMDILQEFTQRTTFHGVKLIFKERVGIVRRVIWSLLLLVSTVMMGVQVVNRLLYYYSYPVTVNYNVNFDKMMHFPTVTICNQNYFRVTEASARQWYELLGDLNNASVTLSEEKLEQYNATLLTLADLYLGTAHQKEDFIVGCEWQNQVCGPHNFTQVLTDQGVCYSFNDNRTLPLSTSSAGPGTGLQLTLNVEQYEYMPGTSSAAGVKILLHNFEQFPRVGQLGLAIAPGSHAFVGVDLLKVNNLAKPHGRCRSGPSVYYGQYSPDACQLACMTVYLDDLCSCRHIYLPHDQDAPPVCSLNEFMTCLRSYMAAANDHARANCDCPAPCDLLQYQHVVSYASKALFSLDGSLTPATLAPVRKRYLQARETTSRLDRVKWQQLTTTTNEIRSSFRNLQSEMSRGLLSSLLNQKSALNLIHQRMNNAWTKKIYLLQWQKYHLEKNFVKAKDEMEEKSMYNLGLGYEEFAYQIKTRIQQLAHSWWNMTIPEATRTSMYVEVLNMLHGRLLLADKAYESYLQLYDAFSNGEPIFTYQFQNESVDDNDYITPRALLNQSISRHDFSSNDTVTLIEDIQYIKDILQSYLSLANRYFYANTSSPEELETYNSQILEWGPRFLQSKNVFYTDSVDYPVKIMQDKLQKFEQRWRDFEEDLKPMTVKLDMLLVNLSKHQNNMISVLEQNIAKAEMHVSVRNVSKQQMAEVFTNEQFLKGVSELTTFFGELRARGQEVYDGWSALNRSTKAIWAMILDDENMLEYYRYTNETLYLHSLAEVSSEVARNFSRLRDTNNVQHKISQVDGSFVRSFQRMVALMKEFIAGSDIDAEFLKNNFLRLDVYYKRAGYEEITQRADFDVFALLCDIGGTMAFYLGASVLTVCELLDLGLHHFIYKLTHNDKIHGDE
ncbi:unnamed protein product [Candidula unifasciata]|uniref:Uncharacterized protein n=1 Tax=Candidula unifasciata TaxID=100452 RepID=A0A8S3ZB13_9EUPU|nr:unnamed protein product [Candidula unifasciata]